MYRPSDTEFPGTDSVVQSQDGDRTLTHMSHRSWPLIPDTDAQLLTPVRPCDLCGERMKQLGTLPDSLTGPAIRVFRCYACNHVASDPF